MRLAALRMPSADKLFWPLLGALWMGLATWLAVRAPMGPWLNEIFGYTFWANADPEGCYVMAGTMFWTEAKAVFIGHPGLPLQGSLGLLAAMAHAFHRLSGGDLAYYEYCAVHLRTLFILGHILTALIHLASMGAIARLAASFGNRQTGRLAALIYGTSFPVLFYLNRIAPEPWMILGVAMAMESTLRSREARLEGNLRNYLTQAAIAGLWCAFALLSKVHLTFALPLWLLAYLVWPAQGSMRPTHRLSWMSCLPFLLGLGSLIAIASLKMDWGWFFASWKEEVSTQPGGELLHRGILPLIWDRLGHFLDAWLGPLAGNSIYAEWIAHCFVLTLTSVGWGLLALSGIRGGWKENRQAFMMIVGYAMLMMPIAVYRASFHYQFVTFMAMAILAAVALRQLSERLQVTQTSASKRSPALTWMALMLAACQFPALGANIVGWQTDRERYLEMVSAYIDAWERVEVGTRMLVLYSSNSDSRLWNPGDITGAYSNFIDWDLPVPRAYLNRLVSSEIGIGQLLSRKELEHFNVSVIYDVRTPPGMIRQLDDPDLPLRRPPIPSPGP